MSRARDAKLTAFFADLAGVSAAYLFGSQCQKKTTRHSDVDLAVLYRPNTVPALADHLSRRDDISALLKQDVDLVCMNRASPILLRQIYKYGRALMVADPRLAADFFTRAQFDYDDISRIRRRIEKNILKRRVYG